MLAALDPTDITPVQPRFVRQSFLAHPERPTPSADSLT